MMICFRLFQATAAYEQSSHVGIGTQAINIVIAIHVPEGCIGAFVCPFMFTDKCSGLESMREWPLVS